MLLLQKPRRILRPALPWKDNLDWTVEDTLQLTLGEEDVHWELEGSHVAVMDINEIKPVWKVSLRLPGSSKQTHGIPFLEALCSCGKCSRGS